MEIFRTTTHLLYRALQYRNIHSNLTNDSDASKIILKVSLFCPIFKLRKSETIDFRTVTESVNFLTTNKHHGCQMKSKLFIMTIFYMRTNLIFNQFLSLNTKCCLKIKNGQPFLSLFWNDIRVEKENETSSLTIATRLILRLKKNHHAFV